MTPSIHTPQGTPSSQQDARRGLAGQAEAITRASHAMATSLSQGGRLVAFGSGATAPDARHVAVEFLHPVIVGKRALPALAVTDPARLAVSTRSGDVVLAFDHCQALDALKRSDVCIVAVVEAARAGAFGVDHLITLESSEPSVIAELRLTTYHIMWELVHVVLAHQRIPASGPPPGRPLAESDVGLQSLYPFLYGDQDDLTSVLGSMERSTREKIEDIRTLRAAILNGLHSELEACATRVAAALSSHQTLFTFGNGGSSCDAQAVAGLSSRGSVICLNDDIATTTALANDVGFDVVFARQLAALARPGDVAMAFSTSGSSANIVAGITRASELGLTTIAFAGYDGGKLAELANIDHLFIVPSNSVHRIQEVQATLYHKLFELIEMGASISFEAARKVADAVLYEGYVLYPYRASSTKNQVRWQWGVVAPVGGTDPSSMCTECLIESNGRPSIQVRLRFLQVQERRGGDATPWEEGVERSVELANLEVEPLLEGALVWPIRMEAGVVHEEGIERELWPVEGELRLSASRVDGFYKLRIELQNTLTWPEGALRAVGIRQALIGAHTLLGVRDGVFVSLLEPPAHAANAVASCSNVRTWPVLVGEGQARNVMLSSPIILYDYPAIAPESGGDFCDATEIDEMLTLRVQTLTDAEKAEAMATDDRSRAIIERSDNIPREHFEKLHGAVRSVRTVSPERGASMPAVGRDAVVGEVEFPGFGTELTAAEDWIDLGEVRIRKGSKVKLHPKRRADAMDMFLEGMIAHVEGIFRDVDGGTHVAVTLDDDPGQDLNASYGRFYYFHPDEIEAQSAERGE